MLLEDWIPFGMGQNGLDAGAHHFIENAVHLLGDELVAKFDQKVIRLVDGKPLVIVHQLLDVLVRQVEVTAQQQLGSVAHGGLELRQLGPIHVLLIVVLVVTMRRSDKVGNSVGSGHLAHLDRNVEAPRPIVYPIDRMAMDVDHSWTLIWH